jgi:hypothetical protein
VRHVARILGLLALVVAGPAAGQVEIESFAAASSYDEIFEPFESDEDYEEDSTDQAGAGVSVNATTCIDPCVVMPPAQYEAEAAAETDFGSNEVDAYSESWEDGANSSYHDSAQATSRWQDELTLSSVVPGASGSLRVTFRVEGSWQNLACFTFVAFVYDPSTIVPGCVGDCCGCPTVHSLAAVANSDASECEASPPWNTPGSLPLTPFPDFGDADGEAAVTTSVELPLILDRPLRLGARLAGGTGALSFSTLEAGVTAVVESLEVPAGVEVDSAAGALAAYHVTVPEPVAGAGAAGALLALLGLRSGRRAPAAAR